MSVSLAELDQVDPDAIDAVFKAATDRAAGVRNAAGAIGDVVAAAPWEGKARDAAMEATGRVQLDLFTHATECEAIAKAAELAETEFREIKTEWTRVQRMADKWGISIDVQTGELSYMPVEPRLERTMEERVDIIESEIQNLLVRAAAADDALAGAIRVATGLDSGEQLDQQLGDRPEVPMDEEAGNADAQDVLDGEISPETWQRLQAATNLTDDQRNALLRGDTAQIPAEQLEYLVGLSNSLDGSSSTDLTYIVGQLGAEQGGALSNAVALASNPRVTAGPTAPGKPGGPLRGDAANIPSGFQEVMNALPLIDTQPKVNPASPVPGSAPGQPGNPDTWRPPTTMPKAHPGLDDLATFIGAGDPTLQTGSAISQGLMDKSEQLLRASETVLAPGYPPYPMDDRPGWYHTNVDPTLQHMLSVAGRDSIALHDAVTGPGAQQFLREVNQHQWADDGVAVNDMFKTVSSNALIENANDATDVALATRSGETAHAFADYWANNWHTLKDIDGSSGIGQVNPHLTRGMAHMLDPYIGDMVGRSTNPTAGFDPLDSEADLAKSNTHHARALFALMNTDDEAAQFFNTEAMKAMLFLQDRAADSLARDPGGAFYSDMQAMGQLQGVIDAANEVEYTERVTDGNTDAQNAYDRRNRWIELITQGAGHLPVVGAYTGDASALLKQMFDPPVPRDATQAPALADMNYAQYYMIDNFARHQLGDLSKIAGFWENGEIISYQTALDRLGAGGVTDNVGQYVDSINKSGRDVDKLLEYWYKAYNNARSHGDMDTG